MKEATITDTADRFDVTILRPSEGEIPEAVRVGFRMLAKVIADQMRNEKLERKDDVWLDSRFVNERKDT